MFFFSTSHKLYSYNHVVRLDVLGELENLPVDQSPTTTLHYYGHIWCPHCIHINSQKQRVITCTYLPRQVLGYQRCRQRCEVGLIQYLPHSFLLVMQLHLPAV